MLYATTIPPYKEQTQEDSRRWLDNIGALAANADEVGVPLRLFCAFEVDGRGMAAHQKTLDRLEQTGLPYDWWQFSIGNGSGQVNSRERLHRICAGRNLIIEKALADSESWLFHVDSDLTPDPKSVGKLLALDWPVVGGEISEYCLDGPLVKYRPDLPPERVPRPEDAEMRARWGRSEFHWNDPYPFPVARHWNTAGYLLLHRDVFRRVRWGHDDYDMGITDDPWTQDLIERATGFYTLVRKDCVGVHDGLVPMEQRGHDLRIV